MCLARQARRHCFAERTSTSDRAAFRTASRSGGGGGRARRRPGGVEGGERAVGGEGGGEGSRSGRPRREAPAVPAAAPWRSAGSKEQDDSEWRRPSYENSTRRWRT